MWIYDIMMCQDRGTKLLFPWFRLALITKVLDSERVVVQRCKEKPFSVVQVDRFIEKMLCQHGWWPDNKDAYLFRKFACTIGTI